MAGFHVRPIQGTPFWAISAPYWSPKLNAAARSVPGTTWNSRIRAHTGYPDAIEQVVCNVRALGLNSDDGPVNERDYSHNLPVSYESAREYQKVGIDFLITNAGSGALLADDMGCGKSLQAAKAMRALRRKAVVVCPAHVRGVWERESNTLLGDKGGELAKWWPDAKVFKPYGLKPKPIPADCNVVVCHYDIVHAWVPAILEWAEEGGLTVVFDEAHALLSQTSRRSKACRQLAYAARGRIALTGTPPVDRVKDLYNIVDTISPGRWGEFFPFGIRFCHGRKVDVPGPGGTMKTVWTFDGRSNVDELRRRLDWFTLRRTKREVLKELPAMTRQIIDVEVPSRNRSSVTALVVKDKKRMRAVLDSAADGKFKQVLAIAREQLEAGKRIVVGTYRRAVCEKIAAALNEIAPTSFIHGGVPITNRGKIIDKLRHIEGPCALVANIDATSTGIDLTFASVVIVAELVWEPRDLVQFEARSHRFGQDEPVSILYVIARGTGDELILHAVINKLDNFLDLVETDAGDGLKETFKGQQEEGLGRLAAALKKMGAAEARKTKRAS
jgi:SWI/SNF-related matrix-associated actin-dependent regulator of chromatin subfamily A-like protein 1